MKLFTKLIGFWLLGQKLLIFHPFVRALNEYAAFDEAIGKALEMVDLSETLVMVTADHSHVFSFGSSGERGANVFGLGTQHVGYDEDEAFIRKFFLEFLYTIEKFIFWSHKRFWD